MKRGGFQSIEIRLNICYTWEEEFSIERVLRRGESIMAISEEVRQRFAGEFEKFQAGIECFFKKEIAQRISKALVEDLVVMQNADMKVQCCVCVSWDLVFFLTK